MSEMVERAAKILFDEFASNDGSPCCLYSDEVCRKMARAVISAMREPDEAMITDDVMNAFRSADSAELRAAWRAMVDEALKDK